MPEIHAREFDDIEVMAYADGALEATRAAAIGLAAQRDAGLRARIEMFSASRRILGRSFDAVLDQPVPDALRRWLAPAPEVAPHHDAGGWRRRVQRFSRAPLRIAAAAGLVAALALGWNLQRDAAPDLLAQAAPSLERGASGTPVLIEVADRSIEVLPLASFRSADGRWCRDYEAYAVTEARSERGRACRDAAGEWSPVVVARDRAPADEYVPASGDAPEAQALRRLTAEEEAAALAQGWPR